MTAPDGLPTLSRGMHQPYAGNACAMEYVSLLAGEKWSDHPVCTDRVLAHAVRFINDSIIDDKERTELLLPHLAALTTTSTAHLSLEERGDLWIALAAVAQYQIAEGPAVQGWADSQWLIGVTASLTRAQREFETLMYCPGEADELRGEVVDAIATFMHWARQHDLGHTVLPALLEVFKERVDLPEPTITQQDIEQLVLTKAPA